MVSAVEEDAVVVLAVMVPALYRKPATTTQYTMRHTVMMKGRIGKKKRLGMVLTAWLATLMQATATCVMVTDNLQTVNCCNRKKKRQVQ